MTVPGSGENCKQVMNSGRDVREKSGQTRAGARRQLMKDYWSSSQDACLDSALLYTCCVTSTEPKSLSLTIALLPLQVVFLISLMHIIPSLTLVPLVFRWSQEVGVSFLPWGPLKSNQSLLIKKTPQAKLCSCWVQHSSFQTLLSTEGFFNSIIPLMTTVWHHPAAVYRLKN